MLIEIGYIQNMILGDLKLNQKIKVVNIGTATIA